MTPLNTLELAVLDALRDERPRMSTQLAATTDQPSWAIRAILKELRRRRFVSRGMMYDWTITAGGLNELASHKQLRLVR